MPEVRSETGFPSSVKYAESSFPGKVNKLIGGGNGPEPDRQEHSPADKSLPIAKRAYECVCMRGSGVAGGARKRAFGVLIIANSETTRQLLGMTEVLGGQCCAPAGIAAMVSEEKPQRGLREDIVGSGWRTAKTGKG